MVEYIKLERQALSLELSIETRIFIVVDLNKRFQNKILMFHQYLTLHMQCNRYLIDRYLSSKIVLNFILNPWFKFLKLTSFVKLKIVISKNNK